MDMTYNAKFRSLLKPELILSIKLLFSYFMDNSFEPLLKYLQFVSQHEVSLVKPTMSTYDENKWTNNRPVTLLLLFEHINWFSYSKEKTRFFSPWIWLFLVVPNQP